MWGRDELPTDIGKSPALIKAAQEELLNVDLLVCGNCLTVCYFVEEFKQHKLKPCKKDATNIDRDSEDTRPKIWAFLLWKAKRLSTAKKTKGAVPSAWALYQNWCKLDNGVRETWIVAGKTILSFSAASKEELVEMPVKITKTIMNSSDHAAKIANIKTEAENGNLNAENSASRLSNKLLATTTLGKKLVTGLKPPTRRAKRTPTPSENSTEIVEENVEKILAKRYNPRTKLQEYLVKWEARLHDHNTWEPAVHLVNVPHLLDIFERQLAQQKESRARLQNSAGNALSGAPLARKILETQKKKAAEPVKTQGNKLSLLGTDSEKNSPNSSLNERPTRTSKTRAMDQVKQWMSGSPSPSSSPHSTGEQSGLDPTTVNSSTVKRKLLHDGNTTIIKKEIPTTTNTIEDLEDDLIPTHTVKRLRNGTGLAVEVNTKNPELDTPKVNGSNAIDSAIKGSNASDVVITTYKENSGITRKPGAVSQPQKKFEPLVRIISKSESTVSSSGIVRLSGGAEVKLTQAPVSTTGAAANRVTSRAAISPSGGTTTQPRTPITVGQRTSSPTIRHLAGGTTIQRKIVSNSSGTTSVQRNEVSRSNTTLQSSGGRILLGQNNSAASVRNSVSTAKSTVTPEQKILQLSKSGDLKVTKKLMTREDVQQQRQQQLRQQQQQPSQVQIQKVQQITPSGVRSGDTMTIGSGVTAVLKVESYSSPPHDESTLCPITGKILGGPNEDQEEMEQQAHAADVLQAAQMMEELQQQQPPQQQLNSLVQQQQQLQQQLHDIDPSLLLAAGEHQMPTNEDGTPMLITGEDGTVYQVAGKNAEGQTILVTQSRDGGQQFAYVATTDNEENHVMGLDNAVAEAVAQLPAEQQAEAFAAAAAGEGQYLVKTTQEDGTSQVIAMTEAEWLHHQSLVQQQQQTIQSVGPQPTITVSSNGGQLCIQTIDNEGNETSIPAEIVQADLPSSGGTRRVVLLLQDGTFMMSDMHENEFKTLNIQM